MLNDRYINASKLLNVFYLEDNKLLLKLKIYPKTLSPFFNNFFINEN